MDNPFLHSLMNIQGRQIRGWGAQPGSGRLDHNLVNIYHDLAETCNSRSNDTLVLLNDCMCQLGSWHMDRG